MLVIIFVIVYIPSLVCTDVQFTVKNCYTLSMDTIVIATYNGSEVITNFSWFCEQNNKKIHLGKSWQINRYENVFQVIAEKDYYNTKWGIQLNSNIYFSENYTCSLTIFIIFLSITSGILFVTAIAFITLEFRYGFPILFQLRPLANNNKKYIVVVFCLVSLIAWIFVAIKQEEWMLIIPLGIWVLIVQILFTWELTNKCINNRNQPIEILV
jgi:hypothetical protein